MSTFLKGVTFHTQSMNCNKIKRDIGRHILKELNFSIKRRESDPSYHLLKMALIKSASDSLRDVFIQWMYTHTLTIATNTERFGNHVSEGKNSSKI